MSLSMQYSAGAYTGCEAVKKTQSMVEIRFAGQEIGEVIAVYPQVSLSSCEAASGRVTYSGRLICTLIYTDSDGKLCRIQKGAEFSHYADDDIFAPAHIPQCTLSCEKTQVKRDGSAYLVAVVIGANIAVFAAKERNILTAADGAIVNVKTQKMYSAVTFSGESEVEDDFDCNAEDILIPATEAIVTDCSCRAGVVEVTGEIYLSLLAVRDGKPVCFDRIIPYKCEIACEEALLARKAVCRAEVKEISMDARINEDKGKCDIEICAQLSFTGKYYDEEELPIICDAFSPDCQLQLTFAEENTLPCTQIKTYTQRIGGLCATKAKLDYGCVFLATALPKAEFARTEKGIEGSVSTLLLYEQNGEVHSTEVHLPFAVELADLNSACNEITVAVCGANIRQRSEGECEAEAVLKICAADCEASSVKYVSGIVEGEKYAASDSAISVYFPAAGDDLWQTAKKLRCTTEDIVTFNPNLTYPLTGKERIILYRSK